MEQIKVKTIYDKVSFGQFKNQSFVDIFKYAPKYLEWIINKTEICFNDLNDFFIHGKPCAISFDKIPQNTQDKISAYIKENNKPSIYGQNLITIENIHYLIKNNLIKVQDLTELNYEFPKELIELNNIKLNKI
jgi:hypothetical protein